MEEKQEEEKEVKTEEERKPQEVTINDIELEKLQEEARDFKRKYLQLLADADNARKRLQKDREEITQYSIQSIIHDFLHPIDHMENALKFTEEASDEVKHWATGFQMILSQFKDVLANNNVKPIDALGKPFDPHFHEAIEMVITTETEPGMIVEECVKGYLIGEKTLRPSKVKVSKAPEEKKETETSEDVEEAKN